MGQEDLLEKEMATHSSMLAQKIPWTGAWQATVHGVTSVGHDLATKPPPLPSIHQPINKWFQTSQVYFLNICTLPGFFSFSYFLMSLTIHNAILCHANSLQLSPPDSSVHGILQARILQWINIPKLAFLTSNLNWQVGSLPLASPGKPYILKTFIS